MQHSTVLHSAQYRADLISSDSTDLSPGNCLRLRILGGVFWRVLGDLLIAQCTYSVRKLEMLECCVLIKFLANPKVCLETTSEHKNDLLAIYKYIYIYMVCNQFSDKLIITHARLKT